MLVSRLFVLLVLAALGQCAVNEWVAPIVTQIPTAESPPVNLPTRVYIPPAGSYPPDAKLPAIVFMHGTGGLLSGGADSPPLTNFKRWSNIAMCARAVAVFSDSYLPRGGKPNADAVAVRPYDAYAGLNYLLTSAATKDLVDPARIFLVGWSHGGTAVLASSTSNPYTGTGPATLSSSFQKTAAFYPGCGMTLNNGSSTFGGLSKSTYCPYNPVRIYAAALDPLTTSGNCQQRIDHGGPGACATLASFQQTVYAGAQHSFDQSTCVAGTWTQQDVDACTAADPAVLAFFGLTCARTDLWTDPSANLGPDFNSSSSSTATTASSSSTSASSSTSLSLSTSASSSTSTSSTSTTRTLAAACLCQFATDNSAWLTFQTSDSPLSSCTTWLQQLADTLGIAANQLCFEDSVKSLDGGRRIRLVLDAATAAELNDLLALDSPQLAALGIDKIVAADPSPSSALLPVQLIFFFFFFTVLRC